MRGVGAVHKGVVTFGVLCMGLQLAGNEARIVRMRLFVRRHVQLLFRRRRCRMLRCPLHRASRRWSMYRRKTSGRRGRREREAGWARSRGDAD